MSQGTGLAAFVFLMLAGCVSQAAASDDDIRVVETSRHSGSNVSPDALVYPVAVLVDAGWSKDRIDQAIREAESIFSQCDVQITVGAVYWLEGSDKYHDLDERDQSALLAQIAAQRPAAMFINQTTAGDIAYSYLHGVPVPSHGTAWITRRTADSCAGPLLAHELGHILLNSPRHSSKPGNLMAATCSHSNIEGATANTRLSGDQCERLRNELRNREN